jgi:hypothetical protein
MAFFHEVETAATPTARATMPQVFINGKLQRQIVCTACDDRLGVAPAEARLQIHSESLTLRGPITLRALSIADDMRPGARVKVAHGDDVYFLGTLLPKNDQGSTDGVSWKALDDRWILSRLPVRGALVNDGGFIKFFSRYTPEMNPDGRWNCMGATYDGRVWPVFAPFAEKAKMFAASEENFPATLAENTLGPWTPRRALEYLYLLTHCERDGFNQSVKGYRTLRDSVRIDWPVDAAGIISGDTGDGDPLDKKLPELMLQRSVLSALVQVLRAAGTHDLRLEPVGNASRVVFADITTLPDNALDIPVIRGGVPDDINTAYDFDLHEDPTDTAEAVLVEGASAKAEAQFEYDPAETNNTIKPAWNATRQGYFAKVIWGAAETAEAGEWAMIPTTAGAEPTLACNGANGTPTVPSCSAAAVQLARRLYPDVWAEFVVDSTKAHTAGILKGLNADGGATSPKYANDTEYPFYSGARPVLPTQLQHFQNGSDTLPTRMPIRVQVKSGDTWLDTPYSDGLRLGPLSFALFGLAEPADGQSYCLYEGSLITDPWNVTVRPIRVNMAVPLDHRVRGYAELGADERTELDGSLAAEFGGPIMDYIPDGEYREEYQFQSRPSAEPPANTGDTSYDANGQTGYLPPGSEQPQADAAAARMLQKRRYLQRRSSWRLVGIRPDFRAGLWIGNAKVRNGEAGDRDYPIQAPVSSVCFDFLGQTTHVGGLVATIPAPRDPAAAVSQATPEAGTAIDDAGGGLAELPVMA